MDKWDWIRGGGLRAISPSSSRSYKQGGGGRGNRRGKVCVCLFTQVDSGGSGPGKGKAEKAFKKDEGGERWKGRTATGRRLKEGGRLVLMCKH